MMVVQYSRVAAGSGWRRRRRLSVEHRLAGCEPSRTLLSEHSSRRHQPAQAKYSISVVEFQQKYTYFKRNKSCVQLPASADNVTLLAFAAARRAAAATGSRRYRSISSGRRAHSSKPQTQTDKPYGARLPAVSIDYR